MPPRRLGLPDGRTLAYDDVGDPAGTPVIYLHGTPDCRLARHPDDELAAALGVRLVAIDRPGCGQSSPHPAGTVGSFADDVWVLIDALRLDRVAVLAWSGGAVYALGVGAHPTAPGRVVAVGIAAGLVPIEAYDDPDVAAAVADSRGWFIEAVADLDPVALAVEVAPLLVPYPLTLEMAREHVAEAAGPVRQGEYAAIAGAAEQLALALVETVQGGLDGVEHDVRVQATPLDIDLSLVSAPVHLWYGAADLVCPPLMGQWFAARLAHADLVEIPGADHGLALTHWAEFLGILAR